MTDSNEQATNKYRIVREHVETQIRSGAMQPGDKLPTESELMKRLEVSRTPIRQAFVELERDGWIYRIRGSGSYVKQVAREATTEIYAILYSDQRGIEKDIIHGMRRAVAQHASDNIHLILKKPGSDTKALIDVIHRLPKPAIGGLVLIPIVSTSRQLNRLLGASLRKLSDRDFHVVLLDRCIPEYEGHCVTSNHQSGAMHMIDHLVSMGHTRIGCIYEHSENTSIRDRLAGVRNALLNHSIDYDRSLFLDAPPEEVSNRAYEIIDWIQSKGITALFCFESELAHAAYGVLHDSGFRIPDDISLCSFDDHSFTHRHDQFLTAMIQKLEELGYFAIDIILNSLSHEVSGHIKMMLEPEPAIRSSVTRIEGDSETT